MKPNVILIVADTLRKDYSSDLNRLKELNFIEYDNVFSSSPWTLPSHISMFNGLFPYIHGVHEYFGIYDLVNDYSKLSKNALFKFDNLISLLKDENYKTITISANGFISKTFGFNFDENFFIPFPPLLVIDEDLDSILSLGKNKLEILYKLIREDKFKDPKLLLLLAKKILLDSRFNRYLYFRKSKILHKGCNLILKILRQINFEDRFFLFINLMEAHEPYSKEVVSQQDVHGVYVYNFLRSIFVGSAEEYMINHYRKYYGIHAKNATNCVMDIISIIREKINLDNSLIIVTSDHGNHIGEYGRVNHGYYLSDELLRVPLYIKYPKDTKAEIKLKNNFTSLTSVYSIIKSHVFNEMLLTNEMIISESYGPQHSLRTVRQYFSLSDSELKKYYTHKVRLTIGNNYVIYDIDNDKIIESTTTNTQEYIKKIKDIFL